MKFRFNRQAAEDLRHDLRRAAWAASAAIYGLGYVGLPAEYTMIGAAITWMGLQGVAFILGCLEA